MSRPKPLPHLAALQPYRASAAQHVRFNLSANEAFLGASPLALAAAMEASRDPATYPDGNATRLREAIAERYDLDPVRIVCSAGSEELISLLVQAYAAPSEEVLFSQYGFIKYELAARAYGALPVRAPERDCVANVDALLAGATERTRILFLANPNNPTGTYISAEEVRRLRAGLREDVLLVIDAAYAEYVESPDYSDGLAFAHLTENTIMLRTFSKIHGLAGLRCGWGYAAASVVESLHRVRAAFNVGAVAQAAATAAIRDLLHEGRAREHTHRSREQLAERLRAVGLRVIPSVCNFLAVRFSDAPAAQHALQALAAVGVLVMPLAGYGLPEALRITIGSPEANALVGQTLEELAV